MVTRRPGPGVQPVTGGSAVVTRGEDPEKDPGKGPEILKMLRMMIRRVTLMMILMMMMIRRRS